MSRINTNVQSLIAQRVLGQNNAGLNTTLERLSTGLRINRGKDDPAGLIASENLRADITSLNAAISNGERADQVVNIAEGGLNEVSSLLNELQGLITTSANSGGLSRAELEANQLQIDSILQTVDRIAGETNFQGNRLLNGNLAFQTQAVDSGVQEFQINGALFDGAQQNVDVIVTQSAQRGSLALNLGSGAVTLSSGSTLSFNVTGALGTREVSFASGASVATVAATINTFTGTTGVRAAASGNFVRLESTTFGSEGFVSVQQTGTGVVSAASAGVFTFSSNNSALLTPGSRVSFTASAQNPVRDAGQDVRGTINGVVATGRGTTLNINTDFLDASITLGTGTTNRAQTLGATQVFQITGGGATFQLGGDVSIGARVGLGIQNVSSANLGQAGLGFLNELASGQRFNVVDASPSQLQDAQDVVDAAISRISSTRGRLGAFQRNVIGSTIRSLGIAVENTAAANSVIADADFASETAALTRNQILVQAATNTLSLANQNPQAALSLLG